MPRLISVNVGMPRDIEWHGEIVHTGIWKEPVRDQRVVRRLNVDGDGQGDLAGHGGEHRAVMVYQLASYQYWERQLGRNDFSFGQFGENFTVDGLRDDEVFIGDRYRIGTALFEVTQPRVTCYRVGIRMNDPQMPALLVSHHRPGFYFRVLEEGTVAAGDEIRKVADGPERMTVSEVDGLLYLPGHPRERLERTLHIPALSPGWKASFQALLEGDASEPESKAPQQRGNAGLTSAVSPPPAWIGFRPLRVAHIDRESASVLSFWLETTDGSALPAALPGQSLVIKLKPQMATQPVLRNYSISSAPGEGSYRISVKQEEKGVGSSFLHNQVRAGDVLECSAPRGNFTLRAGNRPVVLLSAGIGATPLLAMLHALAAARSVQEIWWLYGARNGNEHPFAQEACKLLKSLQRSHRYVAYSRPMPEDKLGRDFDEHGHLDISVCERLGIPRDADFYLCGPRMFLTGMTSGLQDWGAASGQIHTETFGAGESSKPGIVNAQRKQPHALNGSSGTGPEVSFARSGVTARWSERFRNLLELAEACDVPVKWACRTGVCHSCECSLIGGDIVYRPDPLDLPASGNILICCAQPASDVQIDL